MIFLTEKEVLWHGLIPLKANWSAENRFIAYTLVDSIAGNSLYIAFNAAFTPANLELPSPPENKQWYQIVNTSLASPEDFLEHPLEKPPLSTNYLLPPYSALIAKAL